MKLEQLMEGVPFTLVQGSLDTEIADIIYDSRKAAPGLLFVCIVGTNGTATRLPLTAPPRESARWSSSTTSTFLPCPG